ncbi:KAP family NTPase [Bacillus vallismortis]|nr:KAP family NTPase [Bacillus vallismortis]
MEYKNYLPLTEINQDKLNFTKLSKEIAEFINGFPSDIPLSLSIKGSWGSGKSTMLNFIEKNLNEKCSVIRFNPWLITNKEDLILSIFEEINGQIASKYDKAKEKLKKYSLKFMPTFAKGLTYFESIKNNLDSSSAGVLANGVHDITANLIGGFDKPLSVQKRELESELKSVLSQNNKKIVIFIDELDRLFPEEIITVFQVIKAILDFPGILFIVAMDDEVVRNALSKKGIQSPADYLDKIFQKNYNLTSKYQIRTLTKSYIYPRLDLDDESHMHLKKCLNAYIMGHYPSQIKDFRYDYELVLENCETEEDKIADWKLHKDTLSRGASLMNSYQDVFYEFSNSLDLDNPRKFNKFAIYLLENWPNLYNQIFEHRTKKDLYLYCTFILFITNYFYPEYIDVRYLDRRFEIYPDEYDNIPKFVGVVREHLELIFPIYYTENQYFDNQINELWTTEFIRVCCNNLVSYPDMGKQFF